MSCTACECFLYIRMEIRNSLDSISKPLSNYPFARYRISPEAKRQTTTHAFSKRSAKKLILRNIYGILNHKSHGITDRHSDFVRSELHVSERRMFNRGRCFDQTSRLMVCRGYISRGGDRESG